LTGTLIGLSDNKNIPSGDKKGEDLNTQSEQNDIIRPISDGGLPTGIDFKTNERIFL
jgi:hypothetical protein